MSGEIAAGTARSLTLSPVARRGAGALLLVLSAVSVWRKSARGALGEELWLCNVSTVVQGLGLLLDVEILAATGFMAMAAMGFIGWSLDLFVEGTTPISAAIHLTAMTAGLLEARRKALPFSAAIGAWVLWVGLQPLSFWLTDPALNVNVVYAPWPPFAGLIPSMTAYRVFNAFLAVAFIAGVRVLLRKTVEPRG